MRVAHLIMFRIKICGLTTPADVDPVIRSGADAIGLNFYAPSKRFVDDDVAHEIVKAARVIDDSRSGNAPSDSDVQVVGVFVNEPVDHILRRAERLQLDWIQLHGDEPAEDVANLATRTPCRLLRAYRWDDRGLTPVLEHLDMCRAAGCELNAILLDASHAGQYGGTGKTLDWQHLADVLHQLPSGLPWLLAGGLTSANVSAAIRQLRPSGVDTASGVESAPGLKDPGLVNAFVHQAMTGFSGIR